MEYRSPRQQILFAKLLARAQELGRVPTFDEVRADPNMPDPNNDYAVEFGGYSKVAEEVKKKLILLAACDADDEDGEEEETDTISILAVEDQPSTSSLEEDHEGYEGDRFDEGPLFENEAATPEDENSIFINKDPWPRDTARLEDDEEDIDDEDEDTKTYEPRQPVSAGPTVKLLNYTRHRKVKLPNAKTSSAYVDDSGYVSVVHHAKALFNYRAPVGGVVYASFQVYEEIEKPMIIPADLAYMSVREDNLIEFPIPKDDTLIIVDDEKVIQAAKNFGRDTDDLIYIKESKRDDKDDSIIVLLFARL